MDRRSTAAMNALQVRTRSSFGSAFKSFGTHLGGLLFESQILVKDAVNGINRHPMDGSKRFDALATICFNGCGDRSD